jgi:hypothetical protein
MMMLILTTAATTTATAMMIILIVHRRQSDGSFIQSAPAQLAQDSDNAAGTMCMDEWMTLCEKSKIINPVRRFRHLRGLIVNLDSQSVWAGVHRSSSMPPLLWSRRSIRVRVKIMRSQKCRIAGKS